MRRERGVDGVEGTLEASDVAANSVDLVVSSDSRRRKTSYPESGEIARAISREMTTSSSNRRSMMLEHVLDPRAALRAWRAKLKTGGYLFVEVPLENPVPTWWGTDPAEPYWVGHLTFVREDHVRALLAAAGFAVVAASGHDHPVAPNYVNAGDDPYDVGSVPVALDAAPSKDAHPRLLRVLARAV